MKKRYIHPEVDILQFGEEDIIRTSGPDSTEELEVNEGNWESTDGWD